MTMISGEKLGAALTQAMQLKGVGPKEVAEHFDIKPPSVKDWQKRGCIHKKHLGRLVAYFADVVPEGHWGADPDELSAFTKLTTSETYPDNPHKQGGHLLREPELSNQYFQHAQRPSNHNTNGAPVISWSTLGDDLKKSNDAWSQDELHPVPTLQKISNRTKWLPVKDDSLSPKVIHGDLVAVDPEVKPTRDQIALFATTDNEHFLMRYRPLPSGDFEAYDGTGRVLDSQRHGLSIVATCVGLFRDKI